MNTSMSTKWTVIFLFLWQGLLINSLDSTQNDITGTENYGVNGTMALDANRKAGLALEPSDVTPTITDELELMSSLPSLTMNPSYSPSNQFESAEHTTPTFSPTNVVTLFSPRKGNTPKTPRPSPSTTTLITTTFQPSASPTRHPATASPSADPFHDEQTETPSSYPSLLPVVSLVEDIPSLGKDKQPSEPNIPESEGTDLNPPNNPHDDAGANTTPLAASTANPSSRAPTLKPSNSPSTIQAVHDDVGTNASLPDSTPKPNASITQGPSEKPTGIPSAVQGGTLNDGVNTDLNPLLTQTHNPTASTSQIPTSSPNLTNHPTQSVLSKTTSTSLSEDTQTDLASLSDLQTPLQFNRNRLFSVVCSVFIPQIAAALDEQGVDTFESAAKQLVVDNVNEIQTNLPVAFVNVKDVKVVSQVFAWKVKSEKHLRALESTSTGLDVYFQVDAVVTGYTTEEELERAIQDLFDSNDAAFRRSLDFSSAHIERASLNSIQLTLGIVAGCSGFVAVVFAGVLCMLKRGASTNESSQKSKLRSDENTKPKPVAKTHEYPIQEPSKDERAVEPGWDDSQSESDEMEMPCDDSFSGSILFCPSVERRIDLEENDVFACDQSIIDREEAFNAEWNQRERKVFTTSKLSSADLDDFDDELRRAEC